MLQTVQDKVVKIYINQHFFTCRSESKTNKTLYNSSSTPNFDADKYSLYTDDQASGGYQNFKDQKEAFFSKKQLENFNRPE